VRQRRCVAVCQRVAWRSARYIPKASIERAGSPLGFCSCHFQLLLLIVRFRADVRELSRSPSRSLASTGGNSFIVRNVENR
jgi:hypothetical protein